MRGYPADTVDEYLAAVPEPQRPGLVWLRRILVDSIPGVEEVISYQIPTFKYRSRGLVGISAGAKHCSLHLMSPPLAAALKEQLTDGKMAGATLQFMPDRWPSEDTVRLIVARRIAEVDAARG